jgi:hypothetical protein
MTWTDGSIHRDDHGSRSGQVNVPIGKRMNTKQVCFPSIDSGY